MTLVPAALRSRNYQLFFFGQGISLIGNWITQLATVWLVYQLTGSALMLGFVGFISQIPNFLFGPFGGLIAERSNRHRLLIITQVLAMLQSFALAILSLSGKVNISAIITLSFCQGLINVIEAPTRHTFVKDMIESPDDLISAIGLNSFLISSGRLIGPATGGILLAQLGAGYCFVIDGFSYLAVIGGLLLMRLQIKPKLITIKLNPLQSIKDGFDYAFSFLPIRLVLLLIIVFSLMIMPYSSLMPIFAIEILKGDAHTLGFLLASSGIGSLIGGIYMIWRKSIIGLEKVIAFSLFISGSGLILLAFTKVFWFSFATLFLVGFGSILQMIASNTLIQILVEDDKRGRVLSLYTTAVLGVSPFGCLLDGVLARYVGVQVTLIFNGVICLLAAILFARKLKNFKISGTRI
jgi:MFS family permease